MINFPAFQRKSFTLICDEFAADYAQAETRYTKQGRQNLIGKLLKINAIVGAEGVDLLGKLLEIDPYMRISAVQALQHPFLSCE